MPMIEAFDLAANIRVTDFSQKFGSFPVQISERHRSKRPKS